MKQKIQAFLAQGPFHPQKSKVPKFSWHDHYRIALNFSNIMMKFCKYKAVDSYAKLTTGKDYKKWGTQGLLIMSEKEALVKFSTCIILYVCRLCKHSKHGYAGCLG